MIVPLGCRKVSGGAKTETSTLMGHFLQVSIDYTLSGGFCYENRIYKMQQ